MNKVENTVESSDCHIKVSNLKKVDNLNHRMLVKIRLKVLVRVENERNSVKVRTAIVLNDFKIDHENLNVIINQNTREVVVNINIFMVA